MKLKLLLEREPHFWTELHQTIERHSSSLVEANVLDSLGDSDLIFDPELNIIFNANEDPAVVKRGILDVRFSTPSLLLDNWAWKIEATPQLVVHVRGFVEAANKFLRIQGSIHTIQTGGVHGPIKATVGLINRLLPCTS